MSHGSSCTLQSTGDNGMLSTGTAPWHDLPDAVWNMILRDWVSNDRDVVHAAITEKATLRHMAMQTWNCKQRVTLRNMRTIWKWQQVNDANFHIAHQPSSSPTNCSPPSSLRVGHRGLVRRAVIGVEETDATVAEEASLLPHLAHIAPHIQDLLIVLSGQAPLDGLSAFPHSLRTLHLAHPSDSRYPNPVIRAKGRFFDQALGGEVLRLPPSLTELDLSAVEWAREERPLHGLQLPSTLLIFKLPSIRRYNLPSHPALQLPDGLTTLHMGYWNVHDEELEFDRDADDVDNEALNKFIAETWPQLPSSLTWLHCGRITKQPLGGLVLPPALQYLSLSCVFGTRMSPHGVPRLLPRSLKILEVSGVQLKASYLNTWLPPSLERLQLHAHLELDSAQSPWQLPPSLTELQLQLYQYQGIRNRNQDPQWVLPQASEVTPVFRTEYIIFPETLRKIQGLPPMGHAVLSHMKLPSSLHYLEFGCHFNGPLHELTLPPSLEQLVLSQDFNQNIDQVQFPPTLHTLVLGADNGEFQQSLTSWHSPASLTSLHLGSKWDLPLSQLHLPSTLKRLRMDGFTQPLPAEYVWPRDLEYLEFGSKQFDQSFNQWTPPLNLVHLNFSASFNWAFSLDEQKWPSKLRKLQLPRASFGATPTRMHFHNWPPALEEWSIDLQEELAYEKENNFIPFACCNQQQVRNLPASLRKLYIDLPANPSAHPELWVHLTRFASLLPVTLREIVLNSKYKSRETFNAAVPEFRRFCDALPQTCSFRFSDLPPMDNFRFADCYLPVD